MVIMHYEIVLLAGWVFTSSRVMFGSIFLVYWGYVRCEGTHSTSFHIHIYNGCGQTKTTRQASTLSKTAKKTVGTHYNDGDWRPAFEAVMIAEEDSNTAASAVEQLAQAASRRTGLKIRIPARRPPLAQLTALENEVATSIQDLKTRNRIFGEPPSVDEFLEPAEEQQVGESFEGGDEAIITVVKQEMAEKAGQVIEVESDEEDDPQAEVSRTEMLALCQRLEGGCLQFGNADSTVLLDFVKQSRLL
jgi:hypothetical protein